MDETIEVGETTKVIGGNLLALGARMGYGMSALQIIPSAAGNFTAILEAKMAAIDSLPFATIEAINGDEPRIFTFLPASGLQYRVKYLRGGDAVSNIRVLLK